MNKRIQNIIVLCFLMISISGCIGKTGEGSLNHGNNVNSEDDHGDTLIITDQLDDESIIEGDMSERGIDISSFGEYSDEWIDDAIQEISIDDDSKVGFVRYVDENRTCLQIGISYINPFSYTPYEHKEDYFIFKNGYKTLYVDYNVGDYRWTFADHDFFAFFEDITFDGVEELIIPRGLNGMSQMNMFSAYELKDDEYSFIPSFENIFSYTVDQENKTIVSICTSGDSRNIQYTYIYKYENGEYVLVDEYAEQDGVRVDSHF